ncbi:MAG: two-component sensor histidine kinase [Planctomycetaceae bacterium]|nr:MAG: two-component sensor histidine kinase [Planctomycetaceae bacterium]
MSYRTLKRLLGETSLERKCRLLFGAGLLALITGSFSFYAWQTTKLVYQQNQMAARLLVLPIILEKHWKASEQQKLLPLAKSVEQMAAELKPDDMKEYSWALYPNERNLSTAATSRPSAAEDYQALQQIWSGQSELTRIVQGDQRRPEFHYYGAIYATESCLECHRQRGAEHLQAGDLLGVVRITIPLEKTQRSLNWNVATLMATALVTAFLAMLAAYAIVRYVIVKPIMHLREVSDAVARGALDQRADIRTGDDFEELSHAFNRMLRHLVTMQEEQRALTRSYERKNDELAQANLRLYELNNLKNEFLATMSHELRTPLNSILGFSDVLLGASNLTDKQRRYLSHIQSSGKHLLHLITDVLDLAKIESGKMEVHPVEFSIADLVERLVGSQNPLAENKKLDLGFEVDPRLPPLWQDVGKIQQILDNLLSNAIKFTPEGGRIRVRAQLHDPQTLALVVEDTGIGIPLEDQERIFEKFRQGSAIPGMENPLTREYEGTGLGLSIVRELCRLLGGSIHLKSEFGKGSVFTVLLPLRLPSAVAPGKTEVQRAVHTDSGWNVNTLSVDDPRESQPLSPELDSDQATLASSRDQAREVLQP